MRKEDLNDWTADRLKDEIANLSDKNFNLEWRIKQFEESEGRWKCEIESLRTENERLNVDNAAYSSANTMYKEHLEECELKNKHLFEANGKLEKENAYLKENVRSQRDKIDSLMKELEEEKGKTITISDGAITMRADMWEALNENKALKNENKFLKQQNEYLTNIFETANKPESPEEVMRKTGLFSEEFIQEALRINEEIKKDMNKTVCENENGIDRDALIAELQDQHQQDCIKINQLHVTIDTLVDKHSRIRKTVGMD